MNGNTNEKPKKMDKGRIRLIVLCILLILSFTAIIWGCQYIGVTNPVETIGPGDFPEPDPNTARV